MSSVDKVTIGTQSFGLVIVKVESPTKLDSTQCGSYVNECSTLQLIKGISNNLKRLLKYFSGTAIFAPFLFVIRLDLYLNDDELVGIWLLSTVKSTSPSIPFHLNCHKLPEVSE